MDERDGRMNLAASGGQTGALRHDRPAGMRSGVASDDAVLEIDDDQGRLAGIDLQ